MAVSADPISTEKRHQFDWTNYENPSTLKFREHQDYHLTCVKLASHYRRVRTNLLSENNDLPIMEANQLFSISAVP